LNDGVMVAAVPGKRVPTLYARTGEIVPFLALAVAILAVALAFGARWRRSARND
jgi:apolipoprotein N-acyltransferase